MSTTSAKTSWIGWMRLPGQRWQAVVTADSEENAWSALRRYVEQLRMKFLDSYVGPADLDPNQPALPRRRRF